MKEYEMKKTTAGEASIEASSKSGETRDPQEIQREAQKDYIDNLIWCIHHAQKKVDCSHLAKPEVPGAAHHQECAQRERWDGDFFVVVTCKRESLMENVIRNFFHAQQTCPTPTNDQSVYHYHNDQEKLEYLWTVPDQETCEIFQRNALHIVPEERPLLQMVLDFYDGTLLRKARRLNGENVSTGIILEGH